MPSSFHSMRIAINVFVVLSFVLVLSEAKLRLPYTIPVIQTSHPSVVHPETGRAVAVFPVNFTIGVSESFAYPIELVDGTYVKGIAITQTHIFTDANLKLVFDVPNPGLDFVMNLTSGEYPLLQDQYGSLWKPVSPLNLEVVKQDTKYTYGVGNVGMTSYQSQSESVVTPVGTPQYDYECYRTKACCGLNATNYRKYTLVDSPVPPYACTNTSLTYQPSTFLFELQGIFSSGGVKEETQCILKVNQKDGDAVTCSRNATVTFKDIEVSPQYSMPSTGYMLCRQGSGLTDLTYEVSPIPVVNTAFCSTSRCIGYTTRNYMNDRLECYEYPLGFYTSLDGNNTNQFSFYEASGIAQWTTNFPGLHWIDDVGVSSPNTIQNISFHGDVPPSTGWSLSYTDFLLPLTDTLQPLFPIGRPTRLSARFNDATTPTAIVVEVEYVSFANFTAAKWTIRTCLGSLCSSSPYPAAAAANGHPSLITATVSLLSLGATSQTLPSEVAVAVACLTTPAANPFHTLLQSSTVTVAAAIRPPATRTVNANFAREPLQRVPSPYAASLGASATSRIICQGDYRFSAPAGTCVPLTDGECAIKYRGRRILFNTTMNACMCRAPKLTSPLVFRPLPDPLPPPRFTEEDVRALMKALKLPKFMQTMEEAIEQHDAEIADAGKNQAQVNGNPRGTTSLGEANTKQNTVSHSTETFTAAPTTTTDCESSVPLQVPWFFEMTICCFVVTGLAWIFIIFRDVIYKLAGVGPWPKRYREVKQRPAPPPTPVSTSPAAESPTPPPLPPTPAASASSAAPQAKKTKPAKSTNAAPMSGKPTASSFPHAAPQSASRPCTPSPHPDRQAPASQKDHRSGGKQHSKQRRHSSHGARSPYAARQTAPTRAHAPSTASAPSPLHFDDHAFAAEQRTPFGFSHGGYTADDVFQRDEFTSRSGCGGGGREFNYYDAYEYMPAPPAFAEDPEGQRWYSFTATPPRSPPTEGASWSGPRGGSEDYYAKSPPYGRVHTSHDPFDSPRSAAARSTRRDPPSPIGSEQYPARSPVRQSSRVEVLSSDVEDSRSAPRGSVGGRSHHVESID